MPEGGLIKPRPEKNWNVSARNQERSVKPHDVAAVQLIANLPVSIPSGLRAINALRGLIAVQVLGEDGR